MNEVTHRSVSQFSTFSKCGEAFRLEREAKAPGKPAAWFHQGSAFHKAAEEWERSFRQLDTAEVLAVYYAEYDRLITEDLAKEPDLSQWMTGGRTKASDDITRRRERGAEQVRGYMAYSLQAPEKVLVINGSPSVEVEFDLILDGLKIKGFIDQILQWPDGRLTPRDLKTGTKRPDWPFQLGVYDLAIEDMFDYHSGWGDYYMAKDNRPDPMVDLSSFTRDKLTRWFHDMDRAAKAGLFIPNVGDHCRVCGVSAFCVAVGDRANLYPPIPMEVNE